MDEGSKKVRAYLQRKRKEALEDQLELMNNIPMIETDTMISNIFTVSKDVNLAEFMHKIGGAYRD